MTICGRIGEDAGKEPGMGFLNRRICGWNHKRICGWNHRMVWWKSYWRRRWLRLYRSHMIKMWKGRGNEGHRRIYRQKTRKRKKLISRTAKRKKHITRKILIIAIGMVVYWNAFIRGGFFASLKDMVQIRYMEEQDAVRDHMTSNGRVEPAPDGDRMEKDGRHEGKIQKEGVTIILDKGSVSIFRLEEHMEPGSD